MPQDVRFGGMEMMQRIAVLFVVTLMVAACGKPPAPPENVVARVGEQYLTEAEVDDALRDMPIAQDTVQARQQLIERWVTNELLFQEAQRLGLRDDEDVQRLLRENERSVLISALVNSLYDEEPIQPTPAEVQAYYERNRDQLTLREPFVQVRYLRTAVPDSAAAARGLLQQAMRTASADERWPRIAARFAEDASGAIDLSENYYPENRLFMNEPALQQTLSRLRAGQIAPIQEVDSLFHVLQLVDRAPAGATPKLGWIEDELRQRLVVQTRKQMYARHVERLRNEAQSRGALSVR